MFRIFAWQLARSALGTQDDRVKQNLDLHATCYMLHALYVGVIARMGDTQFCFDKARAVRDPMHMRWRLPPEHALLHPGPDWLLLVPGHRNKPIFSLYCGD
jgi:hypothetical protein